MKDLELKERHLTKRGTHGKGRFYLCPLRKNYLLMMKLLCPFFAAQLLLYTQKLEISLQQSLAKPSFVHYGLHLLVLLVVVLVLVVVEQLLVHLSLVVAMSSPDLLSVLCSPCFYKEFSFQ